MFRQATAVAPLRLVPGPGGDVAQVLLFRRPSNAVSQPGYLALLTGPVLAEDAPTLASLTLGEKPTMAAIAAIAAVGPAHICAWRLLVAATGVWPTMAPQAEPPEASPPQPLVAHQAGAGPAGRTKAREGLLTGQQDFLTALATEPGPPHWRPCLPFGSYDSPAFGPTREHISLFAVWLAPQEPVTLAHGPWGTGTWHGIASALAAWRRDELPLSPLCVAALERLAAAVAKGGATEATSDALLASAATPIRATCQAPRIEAMPVRSPTLAPATHTNCYLLGGSELAVVDPGTPYPRDQRDLFDWLDARVNGGARLTQIWLTHHHADHIGAAMATKARYSATIYAHANTARALQGRVEVDVAVADERVLTLGGTEAWQALFTPGHATGHLCFYNLDRHHLLSGDNVLGTGTSLVPPAPHGELSAYLASLRRMLALPIGLLLPGHGPPAALSSERIADTLRQREARERLLCQLLAGAPSWTFDDLLARLYRGLPSKQRPLAALSMQAHLEKLAADGVVQLDYGAAGDGHGQAPKRIRLRAP